VRSSAARSARRRASILDVDASRRFARLGQLAGRLDAVVAGATGVAPAASGPLVYAMALGSGAFVVAHPGSLAALVRNRLPRPDALAMAGWIGGALVVLGALYAGAVVRGRGRAEGAAGIVSGLNRLLRPLLAVPLLEALAQAGIERDSPGRMLFFIALAAIVAGASVHGWPWAGERDGGGGVGGRGARAGAAVFVLALWAGYAVFFSRLSIVNHWALNTRTVSLGFYDNIFWHSAHGHPLGCSFMKAGYHGSAHFDPILVLVSPLYLLYPRAELLLVLQSVWLGAGVVPVYLIARARSASRPAAAALSAMFVGYPALHGANLYEFHSLTLVVPIGLWLLCFLERGAGAGYWIALAAALLVREDVPILAGFVGIYAVRSGRPRVGWITIVASIVYFVAVKRWGMTSPDVFMTGNDAYAFAFNYDDLIPNHDGAGGLVISLLTNPAFVLGAMVTAPKLLYLAMLFVPLAFLPFFARPGRVMLVWGLLFALLASRPALYGIHFHYPSLIIPVAFALVPAALQRVEAAAAGGRRLSRALLVTAFTASVLASWKLGGIVENAAFSAGYLHVARALTAGQRETHDWIRAQADLLPAEASVGVTNRLGPHCSNRASAFLYPEHQEVDWLFVDEAELAGGALDAHERNVSGGRFDLVARRDTLAVYKRR
jgi:uncharacterized membrane protein